MSAHVFNYRRLPWCIEVEQGANHSNRYVNVNYTNDISSCDHMSMCRLHERGTKDMFLPHAAFASCDIYLNSPE